MRRVIHQSLSPDTPERKVIGKTKKRSWFQRTLRLVGIFIFIWAVAFSGLWVWGLSEGRGGPADVMIILGSNVMSDGSPNTVLEARLETALKRYQEEPIPIICCGAKGQDEPMPEGEAMKIWLIQQGVPEEMISAETESVNTYENIGNAIAFLPEGTTKVLIVTSDYHVPRAIRIARAKGLDASGLASPIWVTIVRLKGNTRELLAWGKFFLMKWTGRL